ncbi:DNA mismatch repair protein [Nocardia sp. NPDC005978]|uniref:MutS-related protein n=1 Tax=Nocardia sp. NPDC005978 TaxID=3156725 RepID=UPI0033A7A27F
MRVDLLQPAGVTPRIAANGDRAFDDLGMESLYSAMSAGDPIVLEAVRAIVPATLIDPEVIRYRQAVLTDCLAHPAVVRELYAIAVEPTGIRRWPLAPGRQSGGKMLLSLQPFTDLLSCLRRLRALCERNASVFGSAGLTGLVAAVSERFDDAYLDTVESHLAALYFENGVHLTAGLGVGNKIADIVLHEPVRPRRTRFGIGRRADRAFRPIEDPEAAANPAMNPIKQLQDRALAEVAEIVAYAADHVHDFFQRLRTELAFYIGCLALHDRIDAAGLPTCMPVVHDAGRPRLRCAGLRNLALCLSSGRAVVGNDVRADDRTLIVVTGANNGGKSTFLRGLGTAQLMMQSGMFVLADAFEADVRDGVFTHFVTDEDRTMTHGKLVDELARISAIVDRISPDSLLLCNESFASTSERDATRIATPLVAALTESGVKLVFVTHLYEFARARHAAAHSTDLFLRADPLPTGARTFHLNPAPPQPGSHATEIFHRVFDSDAR